MKIATTLTAIFTISDIRLDNISSIFQLLLTLLKTFFVSTAYLVIVAMNRVNDDLIMH
jgi:hypothetical protein